MAWNYSNTAVQTTLSSGINNVTTSITVGSVSGFPVSFPYTLALDYGQSTVEIVNVTAAVGTTLTVTRGQDGTSGQSHSAGAVVAHALVARDGSEPQAHIAASTNVHGLAGGSAVVGTTTSQTLTNKTLDAPLLANTVLDNTSTVTLKDSNFTLQDSGDATKQVQFELSGVTTGTTRTLTVPNASSTIVDLSSSQTLTNKSLTSPTITGTGAHAGASYAATGAVSGATVTASGALSGASLSVNSVGYTTLGAAWTSFTPTWTTDGTAPSLGNGVSNGEYVQVGKTVIARADVTFGSTTTFGTGEFRFALPVAASSGIQHVGSAVILDSGTTRYTASAFVLSGGTYVNIVVGSSNYIGLGVPITWATSDSVTWAITYEAA